MIINCIINNLDDFCFVREEKACMWCMSLEYNQQAFLDRSVPTAFSVVDCFSYCIGFPAQAREILCSFIPWSDCIDKITSN